MRINLTSSSKIFLIYSFNYDWYNFGYREVYEDDVDNVGDGDDEDNDDDNCVNDENLCFNINDAIIFIKIITTFIWFWQI